MTGDCHVQFGERLAGKFRRPTQLDLSYLPFDDRSTALANIESALRRIKKRIEESKLGIRVTSIPIAGNDAKLSCQLEQTKQVYSSKQLKEMLERNGFKVMEQCGIDGKRFVESKTERIVMVAKKQ